MRGKIYYTLQSVSRRLVVECRNASSPVEAYLCPRNVSGACFGGANSPWFQPFPPVTPQEPRHPCSPPSALPWLNPTASMRSSQNQTISFLLRLQYDGQCKLKPSRAPAWGVRASMHSSDNAESGKPSQFRFCRCCLRQMRKPRRSGSYHFRCSIIRPQAPPPLRLHPRGCRRSGGGGSSD